MTTKLNAEETKQRFFVLNDELREVTETDAVEASLDGETVVEITTFGGGGHYLIECYQYYNSAGVCRLEITQPLERALRTFRALIEHDTKEEEQSN